MDPGYADVGVDPGYEDAVPVPPADILTDSHAKLSSDGSHEQHLPVIRVVIVVIDGDEPVPALGVVDAPLAVAAEVPEEVVHCGLPVGVPCAAKY